MLHSITGARTTQSEGIYLGIDLIRSVPVRWDHRRSPNTHVLVLGSSGSGKTHTLAALAVRLLRHGVGRHILVIDLKGEYLDLLSVDRAKLTVVDPSLTPLKLCTDTPRGIHLDMLMSALRLPDDVRSHLRRILLTACSSRYSIDLRTLSNEFQVVDKYIDLHEGLSLGLHSVEVLNLSSIPLRSAIPLSALAIGIALARGDYIIVLDEAWHLVSALDPELVDYVYRFSRSYGCSLLVASQSPTDLGSNERLFFENSSLILCFSSTSTDYWRKILGALFPSRKKTILELVSKYVEERGHCLAKFSYSKDPLFLYFDPLPHEL